VTTTTQSAVPPAPTIREYPKIYSPYLRHTSGPLRNQFTDTWARPEFECLAGAPWHFTEKVDGTNVRIHWDGHRSRYGGRTENAQLPAKLVNWLDEHLPEELFEQAFGDTTVTLYGEGYGAGIQKSGRLYAPDQRFVLFDVLIGGWWLERANVEDVGSKLGLDVVPLFRTCNLWEAMEAVTTGVHSSWTGSGQHLAEGLVGVPTAGLLTRAGDRIMVKIKTRDFRR
jgi:hypothetical protein